MISFCSLGQNQYLLTSDRRFCLKRRKTFQQHFVEKSSPFFALHWKRGNTSLRCAFLLFDRPPSKILFMSIVTTVCRSLMCFQNSSSIPPLQGIGRSIY